MEEIKSIEVLQHKEQLENNDITISLNLLCISYYLLSHFVEILGNNFETSVRYNSTLLV